ncbi:carboxymuconolactone decarboxylase family protein [Mycobacterium sp. TY814]|uniref:carboxymuconolactone decarboxylase family protein n=1 Tax=unclassified Mycobacterium TaxID=2642494 RepID=UPI00274075B2|nr:carboxymuconolactone decarboxylase family protein [Mycobacterium sp. TY814]MDP7723951.1 carboxymuconolactone decarboxylase family protein [Mycobacterium sp. TY814]
MSLPADQLTRLVAFSDGRLSGLVRQVCAQTMSLPPLPNPVAVDAPESDAETVVAEFAEQFSADVSAITVEQRALLFKHLGDNTFRVVVAMFIADFVPRVRAGFEALGVGSEYLEWVNGPIAWDTARDPSDEVFSRFLPRVARERALDPVTSELVRLRGATAHNCRLCKSLREGHALDAGGTESLYDEIAQFQTSALLDERAKSALRYADALIWTPAHLAVDDAAEVRSRFSPDEAVELTFDIMRNASNKIAVSLGADAPRVESGTERYLIDVDGQTVFS